MKTTITLLLLLATTTPVLAQCTSAVPAGATIVNDASPTNIAGNGQNYWVCSDAFQKIFTGGNNNIWIESGAWVSINGNGNTVRYKGNVMMGVFGGNNTFYVQSEAAISDQGTGNTINECGSGMVVFTYASAPANGCASVGVEELEGVEMGIYPNPAFDVLIIDPAQARLQAVHIYDLDGRSVDLHAGNDLTMIPIGALSPGVYIVRIHTDRGTGTRRFLKM